MNEKTNLKSSKRVGEGLIEKFEPNNSQKKCHVCKMNYQGMVLQICSQCKNQVCQLCRYEILPNKFLCTFCQTPLTKVQLTDLIEKFLSAKGNRKNKVSGMEIDPITLPTTLFAQKGINLKRNTIKKSGKEFVYSRISLPYLGQEKGMIYAVTINQNHTEYAGFLIVFEPLQTKPTMGEK